MESTSDQRTIIVDNNGKEVITETKKKKSPVRFIVLGLFLIAGGYFAFTKWQYARTHETTDNAQVETSFVPVLPRISGYVRTITVSDYDSVKAGQLIIELDDDEMKLQLAQLEADYAQAEVDVANAKASLNNANVSLGVNRGSINLTQIRRQKALDDFERDKRLHDAQAITDKQFEESRNLADQARQQVSNTQTDLTAASSRLQVLQTNIQRAQAVLEVKKTGIDQQKLKLSYTKIIAPQSGKIGKKNVSAGQYVQAGTPLFTIVTDTTYWIVANFKENQIEKFRPGMQAIIKMDAYPDTPINGVIESLSDATGAKFSLLPPDNSSGNFVKVTQRVPVKIGIKDIGKYRNMLRAGLSVNVEVPVQ